jgi:hypothetical protein
VQAIKLPLIVRIASHTEPQLFVCGVASAPPERHRTSAASEGLEADANAEKL